MSKPEYCRLIEDGALNPIVTQTHRPHIQPAPEPDSPGPWTELASKLCGVVAVPASVGILYLVWKLI